MEKLKRYYNQNRKRIWRIILIIAFAYALLQLANYYVSQKNEQTLKKITEQKSNTTINQANNTTQTNSTQNTIDSKNEKQQNQTDIIKQFVTYCNQKDLESAYNMLTDECKEQMFNDIQDFERIYYNSAFGNQAKDSSIEKWAGSTYLVYYKESALSTGKVKDENQKGDYITVVKDNNDNYKLNINRYIGDKKIDKTKTQDGLEIQVICKNVYMDYEEYTLTVINNSKEEIILDTLEDARTIYIEDTNGVKYSSYNHELTNSMLNISGGHVAKLKIKFYNSYTSGRRIRNLVFSNMKKNNEKIKFYIELL